MVGCRAGSGVNDGGEDGWYSGGGGLRSDGGGGEGDADSGGGTDGDGGVDASAIPPDFSVVKL